MDENLTSSPDLANKMLAAALSNEQLWKIREMYLSDDEEEKDIAYKWLCQAVGLNNANANLFILTFYKDWEDDSDFIIDDKNFWKMKFKTYPISFGKDYMYKVTFIATFGSKEILNEELEYSRWAVGNGQPKWDFCHLLCQGFKKAGYTFYNGLFAKGSS